MKLGIVGRLRRGLAKTRASFVARMEGLLRTRRVDDELFDELEELLISADVGLKTSLELIDELREAARSGEVKTGEEVRELLIRKLTETLQRSESKLKLRSAGLTTYLFVGVNGSGKTTTIGKLGARYTEQGKNVVMAAADTFRAAATEQLEVWAKRTGARLIKGQPGADPASVAYDAVMAARSSEADVLLVDTAGRLQTRKNLMNELGKVGRVVERALGEKPDEILLVVDATTGQNALSQAELFGQALPLTGIILTKLDGTAKGGIVVAIASEYNLPVKLIGVGEGIEDLRDFEAEEFVAALFAEDESDDEG